jgi:hypothetical protein
LIKFSTGFTMKLNGFLIVVIASLLGSPTCAQEADQPQNQQARKVFNTNLYDSKECHDDIIKYCPSKGDQVSNVAVLKCMYDQVKDLGLIDKECHHVKEMTQNLSNDYIFTLFCL